MKPWLAVVRQGNVAEVGEPHAGIIHTLLGADEPRTLQLVGTVQRSAAGIAALHMPRNELTINAITSSLLST